MDARQYDVIVIGAGPTGENVADRAVKGGLSTAIIESELVGGECSYWACIPSKALLQPILANAAARSVSGALQDPNAKLDVAAVLARRDSFTSNWTGFGPGEMAGASQHRINPRPRAVGWRTQGQRDRQSRKR